jgi:hypothetical protein
VGAKDELGPEPPPFYLRPRPKIDHKPSFINNNSCLRSRRRQSRATNPINVNNSISLIPTDAIQCNGVRYKYLSLSFSSVSEFSLSVNSYNIGHERTLCKIPYLTIPQNIPAFNQICRQTPQELPSSAPVLQALLSPLSSPTRRSPTHSTTCAPLRLLPL